MPAGGDKRMRINPVVADIYHGDTVTDLAKARAWGLRGIIHKATEGGVMVDRLYPDRRRMATATGLLWGAYHFLRPGDMKHQAMRFMDEADPDEHTLMAVDHEDPHVSLGDLRRFIATVESELGRYLVLYSGFLIKEQIGQASADNTAFFAARPLWLSHYNVNPSWPKTWARPLLWQFTGDGDGPRPHAVPGIQDDMDINSFDGTDEDLAAAWPGAPIAAPAVA